MWNDNFAGAWSAANFTLIEASLWQENQRRPVSLPWLERSWQDPVNFWKGLHAYSNRRLGSQSKSTPWGRYDFYHDLLARHKDQSLPALVWFEQEQWHTWSYAELAQTVNALAASWEAAGVQPGDVLAILHPPGPQWLTALLAGLRLGLTVSVLPPQGNAFVLRRLVNIAPQWLAIDHLYRHQLGAEWQALALPNTLSPSAPVRRSFEYPGDAIAALCLDPISTTIDIPVAVNTDTLYLGALRDSILGLGLKPGQYCAAPGWHVLESQPSLILAVLLSGACWVQITLKALEKAPERLLEQPIEVLGISRALRNLLQTNPSLAEKTWRFWFRHPAEAADYPLWQEFVEDLQLQAVFSGNLLWCAARGGVLLFSDRCRGQPNLKVFPAAGLHWQLGIIEAQDLPHVEDWGQLTLGAEQDGKTLWNATPYLLAPYRQSWTYLGQYPQGRAGRTYPREEILTALAGKTPYPAIAEIPAYNGGDPRQVLLVFGDNIDTKALENHIKTELGPEFALDRIECIPLLPKRDKQGQADPDWCQLHYQTGGLYRRQRSRIFRCTSALKQMILGNAP